MLRGRLVLADGLIAAGETKAPLIIDAATLTGAAMMALGTDYNALFGLDRSLLQHAQQLSELVNEPAWPLPLEKWHQANCPSHYADTANSRIQKGRWNGGAHRMLLPSCLGLLIPNQVAGSILIWLHVSGIAQIVAGLLERQDWVSRTLQRCCCSFYCGRRRLVARASIGLTS